MPFGAEVVPEECMTIARSSASRVLRSSGASSAISSSIVSGRSVIRSSTSCAASSHFAISFSPPKQTMPLARVWLLSADSCVMLNIGGSGASTTPRCRHPSSATAASIEWRPSRITTSPGATDPAARRADSATAARRSSS